MTFSTVSALRLASERERRLVDMRCRPSRKHKHSLSSQLSFAQTQSIANSLETSRNTPKRTELSLVSWPDRVLLSVVLLFLWLWRVCLMAAVIFVAQCCFVMGCGHMNVSYWWKFVGVTVLCDFQVWAVFWGFLQDFSTLYSD